MNIIKKDKISRFQQRFLGRCTRFHQVAGPSCMVMVYNYINHSGLAVERKGSYTEINSPKMCPIILELCLIPGSPQICQHNLPKPKSVTICIIVSIVNFLTTKVDNSQDKVHIPHLYQFNDLLDH